MNLTNLGLGSVLNLINTCLDHAYLGMLIFGGVGLGLGVLLMVVARKRRLFHRRKSALKWVRSVYPIYIVAVCTLTGTLFGGLQFGKSALVDMVPKEVTNLNQISFSGYQYVLIKNWDAILAQQVPFNYTLDRHIEQVKFEPYNDDWMEARKIDAANDFSPKMSRWGIEAIIVASMEANGQLPESEGMSEEERSLKWLTAAHDADILNASKDFWAKVDAYTIDKIQGLWLGYYARVLGAGLLLLLIPAIETIFNYKRSFRAEG